MAAEDITSLLEYMNSTKLGGDSDDDLPQDAKTQRTQGLETVLARAKELQQPESLDDLLAITQKLATGSRDGQFFFSLLRGSNATLASMLFRQNS